MLDPNIEILLTEEQIREKVVEIGREIARDYEGRELLAVAILKGAVIFTADLIRELDISVSIDFMAVSSYGSSTVSSGVVEIIKDVDIDVGGKHVLVVEDIIDTGLTLDYLLTHFRSRKPASLRVCTLLDKWEARTVEVPIDYRGFFIPNEYVVGYGMDCDQKFRNLPYIGILKDFV